MTPHHRSRDRRSAIDRPKGRVNAIASTLFEHLERRCLLSTVFDYQIYSDARYEINITDGAAEGAILESGLVRVAGREDADSDLILTTSPQSHFDAAGAGGTFQNTNFAPSGICVATGDFWDPQHTWALSGIGVFHPGKPNPTVVLYADATPPAARILSAGTTGPYSNTFRVTIEYADTWLDTETIDGDELRLIDSDGVDHTLTLQSRDRNTNGPIRHATYTATLPALPDGVHSRTYAILANPDAVADLADNRSEDSTLGSFVQRDSGSSTWKEPAAPDPDPAYQFRLAAIGAAPGFTRIDTGFAGQRCLINNDGLVALQHTSFDQAGDDMTELIWWDSSATGTSSSDGIFIGRVEVTDLSLTLIRMLGSKQLLAIDDQGPDGELLVTFSGPNATETVVIHSSEVIVTVRETGGNLEGITSFEAVDFSADGNLIVFLAHAANADYWSSGRAAYAGLFDAASSNWRFTRITSLHGDGHIEADEYWYDNPDDDPHHERTPREIDFGEDMGLTPDRAIRVSTLGTLGSNGRQFTVVFDASSPIGNCVAAQRVSVDDAGAMLSASAERLVSLADGVLFKGDAQRFLPSVDGGGPLPFPGTVLLTGVASVRLLDLPINSQGTIGVVVKRADSDDATVVLAKNLGPRPVLLIPGAPGSQFKDTSSPFEFFKWLMTRGVHPDKLVLDPYFHSYDNLIDSLLLKAGYDTNLVLRAVYDWRMPPAPLNEDGSTAVGPMRRTIDGLIDNVTYAKVTDGIFDSGLDYVVYWLQKAQDIWAQRHPGQVLDRVDVIAHSAGGVYARAYLQSAVYRSGGGGQGRRLPGFADFVMVGTPNRGKVTPWNQLHDDFNYSREELLFIRGICGKAFRAIKPVPDDLFSPGVIAGADGDITWARVQQVKQANPELISDEMAFLALYVPTARAFLATYPCIDANGERTRPAGFFDNKFLKDLNGGLDDLVDDPYWWERPTTTVSMHGIMGGVDITVIAGSNITTLATLEEKVGAGEHSWLWWSYHHYVDGVASISGQMLNPVWTMPDDDQTWWLEAFWSPTEGSETSVERVYGDPGAGDGSDVSISVTYPFLADPSVSVQRFAGVSHGQLVNEEVSQRAILAELGCAVVEPVNKDRGGFDPWDKTYTFVFSLMMDPVEMLVTDVDGRRFGWTVDTGPLTEIPGSVYIGDSDGFGWLSEAPSGPLRVFIRGMEEYHYCEVVGFIEGELVHFVSEGPIGIGEVREFIIEVPTVVSRTVHASTSVRASADDGGSMTVTAINEDGLPVAFQRLAHGGTWTVTDLASATGSGAVSGTIETWVDPKDGLTYAAGLSATGLVLYQQVADGSWNARDLTQEVAGADRIVSGLRVMTSPNGLVNLTGLNSGGDLVRYFQTGSTSSPGHYQWDARNLGEHLRARGQQMPAFVGDLVSYATSWGGLNIVGLDARGAIWGVWWAPGVPGWNASDLSTIYGADPIVGGLTVYLTSWNGINIAGIDAEGHLKVTWWLPRFGGEWAHSDLTGLISGAILDPESVSSFVSSWGGLNVAGLDRDSGEVRVYWWAPGVEGWSVATLSDIVGSGQPRPVRALRGMAAPAKQGSLNVFGVDANDEVIRYYWEPGFGGAWLAQNLSQLP